MSYRFTEAELVDGIGRRTEPEPRQSKQPEDQVRFRVFSDRTRFLRRCQGCASWWRFRKSRIVAYSLITGKRLWRGMARWDCVVCGREVQNSAE